MSVPIVLVDPMAADDAFDDCDFEGVDMADNAPDFDQWVREDCDRPTLFQSEAADNEFHSTFNGEIAKKRSRVVENPEISKVSPKKKLLEYSLSEDIGRSQFLPRFINAVNLGDSKAMKHLILSHCNSVMVLTVKFRGTECPYSCANFLQANSSHAAAHYFDCCFVAIPDSKVHVQDIKSKFDASGATITCRFAFTGTKTLVISDRSNVLITIDKTNRESVVVHQLDEEHMEIPNNKPLRKNLVEGVMPSVENLRLYGSLSFSVDTSGLITTIVIIHSNRKR